MRERGREREREGGREGVRERGRERQKKTIYMYMSIMDSAIGTDQFIDLKKGKGVLFINNESYG